jgi:mannan endo-1,4-beta-mannosidase
MVAWSPGQDGEPEFAELAKTGANAVRIVWVSTASASALDGALRTARAAGLVPLVELHDGQGNFAMLPDLVAYWSAPETVSVVAEHERALLVEIGGGLGGAVPRDTWEAGYRGALATLRAAGLRVPLVIHAPNWGNDLERLIESGPGLLDADPGKNLLFAFSAWEASATTVSEALETMAQLQLPVIVAEFSGYLVGDCPLQPFDYAAFLETTARQRVGWFAWSWGGVSNADCGGALDMTLDGTLSGLQGWGLEVALGHPAGISRTSNQVASGCGAEDP